jgi:superfamily II DNA or RNA helicase
MSIREEVQKKAIEASFGKRQSGLGISMGVGKTFIGLTYLDKMYKEKKIFGQYLIVAPKLSIFETWKQECIKHGFKHLLPFLNFSTYRSLDKLEYNYDAVVLDECHNLTYSHDYWLTCYTGYKLGLTGTPPKYINSEKGKMVNTHCPIVYEYITDDAVEDAILNDYSIVVHLLDMGDEKDMPVKMKTGKVFYSSEKAMYDYWCKKIDQTFSQKDLQMLRILRMKSIMSFKTKESYAKDLSKMMSDKCIVFCNTTDQADAVCKHSYHSKNPDSKQNLQEFKEGKIDLLSCVQQLNEGVNIPNLKSGIILHSYSNERQSAQRIGRLLRLNPHEKSTIHILAYKDSIDMTWVQKALESVDQDKITYTNSVFENA